MTIIGTGGLASDILSSIELDSTNDEIVFYNDTNQAPIPYIASNFKILKTELEAKDYFARKDNRFIVGVGEGRTRKELSEKFERLGGVNITYISQNALVGKYVKLSEKGVVVMHHAVIGNGSVLEEGSVVYVNSSLGHESKIGKYALVSGQVCMSSCTIGEFAFLGIGSVIKPGVIVGSNAIVGIGSVVSKSVSANDVVYGNPAKSKISI